MVSVNDTAYARKAGEIVERLGQNFVVNGFSVIAKDFIAFID
jgi:hypothetical protein